MNKIRNTITIIRDLLIIIVAIIWLYVMGFKILLDIIITGLLIFVPFTLIYLMTNKNS